MIHLLALLLYSAAFLLWLRSLLAGGRDRGALPAWAATTGALVHLVALARYALTHGELPLVGLGPSLSTLALLIALGLVATLALREAQRIGVLLLPLAILLQSCALAAGLRPSGTVPDFQGAWFVLHVALGFTGVVAMALAGASGTLYLAQFRQLKAKRMGRLFHFLPPLATLDRLGRVGAQLAFVLLTLSLALAWAWTVRFHDSLGGDNPEVWWGVFSWFAILGAVAARAVGGGPAERRAALANALAFALIVAGYVVLRVTAQPGAGFL